MQKLLAICTGAALLSSLASGQTQPAGGGNPQNPTGVYTSAYTLNGGAASQSGQTYSAIGDYEFGVYVDNGGALSLVNASITTTGQIGNGVEAGLNSSAKGGSVTITGGAIATTGVGGNGIFAAAGGSTVSMTGGSIACTGQFGHGVLVTYGGSVTLNGVTISTKSGNGAALANDSGGGTITATGVTAATSGSGSPGIYSIGSTTVITVTNSTLAATGEAGAVATGGGSIVSNNSSIKGTVAGVRTFNQGSATSPTTINGGSVTATAGDALLATGASAAFTVKGGATLTASSGNLVNSINSGSATLVADGETLAGNLIADSASTLAAILQNGTTVTGQVTNGGVTLDATSQWTLTGNSVVTTFADPGGISGLSITNIYGNGHSISYNATLAANSYLGGKTYSLAGGGQLAPAGSAATPSIASGGLVNAASGAAGIAPGAWISIFGSNLAASTATATSANLVNGYLPTTLGGTSVTIDGKPAYLDFVSAGQLNVQAPADSATGTVNVIVTTAAGSATASAAIQALSPGLFTASNYVLAVRPSDSAIINGTGATVAGYITAPAARPGDVLEIFATGLGATMGSIAPGLVFSGTYYTSVSTPAVTFGQTAAAVSFSGLVSAGVYQINVTVPANLPDGVYPVLVTESGAASPSTAMLKISSN